MITPTTLSDISSKAEKIKACDTDCSTICNTFMTNESFDACNDHYSIPVYPGKSFMVTIIPLGQADNPAPANIMYKPIDDYNLVLSHTDTNNTCVMTSPTA